MLMKKPAEVDVKIIKGVKFSLVKIASLLHHDLLVKILFKAMDKARNNYDIMYC